MNKIVMYMLLMGLLALSAFAGEERYSLDQIAKKVKMGKLPDNAPRFYDRVNMKSYETILHSIPKFGGSWFTLPYKNTSSVAVQVVRSSDIYYYDNSPVLVLCNLNNGWCKYDNQTKSLSFEISGDKIRKANDGLLHFIVYGVSRTNGTSHGVVVGLYACSFASLSMCTSSCKKNCVHGTRSDVMDACVCYRGFTGEKCETMAKAAPTWETDMDEALHWVYCIVLPTCWGIFYIAVCVSVVLCIRRCVRRRRMLVQQQNAPYYPLGSIPPPPPPPLPRDAIEIPVVPGSRVFYGIPPPNAPATQVPVFIVPPAPMN